MPILSQLPPLPSIGYLYYNPISYEDHLTLHSLDAMKYKTLSSGEVVIDTSDIYKGERYDRIVDLILTNQNVRYSTEVWIDISARTKGELTNMLYKHMPRSVNVILYSYSKIVYGDIKIPKIIGRTQVELIYLSSFSSDLEVHKASVNAVNKSGMLFCATPVDDYDLNYIFYMIINSYGLLGAQCCNFVELDKYLFTLINNDIVQHFIYIRHYKNNLDKIVFPEPMNIYTNRVLFCTMLTTMMTHELFDTRYRQPFMYILGGWFILTGLLYFDKEFMDDITLFMSWLDADGVKQLLQYITVIAENNVQCDCAIAKVLTYAITNPNLYCATDIIGEVYRLNTWYTRNSSEDVIKYELPLTNLIIVFEVYRALYTINNSAIDYVRLSKIYASSNYTVYRRRNSVVNYDIFDSFVNKVMSETSSVEMPAITINGDDYSDILQTCTVIKQENMRELTELDIKLVYSMVLLNRLTATDNAEKVRVDLSGSSTSLTAPIINLLTNLHINKINIPDIPSSNLTTCEHIYLSYIFKTLLYITKTTSPPSISPYVYKKEHNQYLLQLVASDVISCFDLQYISKLI